MTPFLQNTKLQYAWDSTSIGYLKTCPRLYQYTILDGWSSKSESVHLRFGGEFHKALWNYDQSIAAGIIHEDAVFDVVRELLLTTADYKPDPLTKAGKYKNREALIRTVIYYLDHRHQNDNYTTHIMDNGKPAVELSFRFELAFGPTAEQPYLICGHLDRVCKDKPGNLYIEDHKTTTTTLSDHFFNQFTPSNQMSLYTFGGAVLLDMPIKGIIINGVQLLIEHPYNRFVRGLVFRVPDQTEEWVTDLSRWLQIAEWYAENNYWPQNDTACDKFGGCQFRNVCSKSPSVREIYLKSEFIKLPEEDRWNPLNPR